MSNYSKKEFKILDAIYRQAIFTESEIKQLTDENTFIKLLNNNILTTYTINHINLYSLTEQGTQLLDKPYKKTYAAELAKRKYSLNQTDINLIKAIAFCGLITIENQITYFTNANLDRCILANYIIINKQNNVDVLVLTSKSRRLLKKLNCNYFRKNTGIKYANYLLYNYLHMSSSIKRSYFLPRYNNTHINKIFNIVKNKPYIILDIESISHSKSTTPKIIEIGAIKISNGIIVDKFQYIIKNDNNYIPKHVTQLTGITSKMLRKGAPLSIVIPRFLQFIGNLPVLAHGIENDWHTFITNILYQNDLPIPQNILIDTYNIANSIHKGEKNGLDALIVKYNIDTSQLQRHRALNDSILTYKILNKLTSNNINTPTEQTLSIK